MTTDTLPATLALNPASWLDREAYPFTTRRIQLSAGTVSYVDQGQGEPILFVHGTPTWSFEYRHLIRGALRPAPLHRPRPPGLRPVPAARRVRLHARRPTPGCWPSWSTAWASSASPWWSTTTAAPSPCRWRWTGPTACAGWWC